MSDFLSRLAVKRQAVQVSLESSTATHRGALMILDELIKSESAMKDQVTPQVKAAVSQVDPVDPDHDLQEVPQAPSQAPPQAPHVA